MSRYLFALSIASLFTACFTYEVTRSVDDIVWQGLESRFNSWLVVADGPPYPDCMNAYIVLGWSARLEFSFTGIGLAIWAAATQDDKTVFILNGQQRLITPPAKPQLQCGNVAEWTSLDPSSAHNLTITTPDDAETMPKISYLVIQMPADATDSAESTSSIISSPASSPSQHRAVRVPVGVIASSTVGGIAFLAVLFGVAFYFCRRRWARPELEHDAHIRPWGSSSVPQAGVSPHVSALNVKSPRITRAVEDDAETHSELPPAYVEPSGVTSS
ncbi:hypothetical protein EXIGLDRAFT_838666 [Exidia glandulosa HHB12029]|uniref:Mid2 domain-containing protein n=1 Tax=Exidia glandulosa HHB12029 TaxID=1314781 RepID=A0A165FLD8_EXIGL|nr:hypothetical protein EXIGLDRAFT_838666 [Exidia glandulosa HHB12029]